MYAGKCCNCEGVDGVSENFCGDPTTEVVVTGFERIHHWYRATQVLDIILLSVSLPAI